ncbi:MAG TPA: DUF5989 family protein [Pirellulaceae bacterium]|jgi:hypothetical protein
MSDKSQNDDFNRAARGQTPSLLGEFLDFLRHNKKWWLLPILIVLLLFGVLIFLSGTGVAPFIYTLY